MAGSLPEVVSTIDPWALFLALASVKSKVQNFGLLRGELQLMYKSTIGPGVAGAMEVAALPCSLKVGD